jgi:DNA-binding MarR family transcriptional regulator
MSHPLSGLVEVCLALRVRRFARKVSRHYDAALAKLNLDISQFNVLSVIGAASPITLSDVAASLALDRSTLSRTLKPLMARGFVTTEGGRGRSGLRLELSLRGEDVMGEALAAWKRAQGELAVSLGETEMGRLLEALDRAESGLGPK